MNTMDYIYIFIGVWYAVALIDCEKSAANASIFLTLIMLCFILVKGLMDYFA